VKIPAQLAVVSIICLVLFTACSSSPQPSKTTSLPELKPNSTSAASFAGLPLTKDEAVARAKQVAHVTYGLWFGLEDEHQDFEGRAVVTFELRTKARDHGKDIFLDFANGTVRGIVLNGTTLSDITSKDRYDGNRIHFKLNELQPTTNRVEISFLHPYSHNGHGLHRFKDPVDQSVYLYSDLEPYFAHEIFPCFDQPDLKAAFELTVETPEDWQVVTNTLERDVSKVDGRKSWAFPPSPLLAPYVFALIAGDYASWKADADGIPMRLFVRKSLKQYIDPKEWFDVTRKGLDFYSVEFGYPYPYSKYDQILVPEFDAGAMENAAAITFSERMIFRTKVTRRAHENVASTILHEMAHMWFGDLVTMKWWNGLWLNESFATFMSSLAGSETLPIAGMKKETAWENFFDTKTWGYDEDQLVTTHPIDLPVPDTDHAFSNFDGITYAKGASVLKQLRYYLGEDDFREGIQRYFQRYALRNTTLSEFIKMLSEASGKDLTAWQDSWLMTSGVNSVQADWACDGDGHADGKISKFDLIQSPAENSAVLRTHRTEITLYTSKFAPKDVVPATYSGAKTSVTEAIGKACPAAVFPNSGDYDYVKVELDPVSRKAVAEHLSEVPDLLGREMFWFTLWETVIDGKLAPTDYADIALAQLATEKDPSVTKTVLKTLLSPALGHPSAVKFMSTEQRANYLPKIEALTLNKLHANSTAQRAGGDNQLVWFDAFLDSARSMESLEYMKKLLEGKAKIPGLKIDQEVRWNLAQALVRNPGGLSADAAKELIDTQAKLDPTDNGKKLEISSSVQIPDSKTKSAWMDQIVAGPTASMSVADLRSAMRNFYVLGQEDMTQQFVDRYFAELPKALLSPDEEYVNYYTGGFYPALCSQKVIDLTTTALKSDLPAVAKKNLRMARQQEERCLRARTVKNAQ
jgi:aminopeptidase N